MHKQAINHKQAIIGGGYLFTENACYSLMCMLSCSQLDISCVCFVMFPVEHLMCMLSFSQLNISCVCCHVPSWTSHVYVVMFPVGHPMCMLSCSQLNIPCVCCHVPSWTSHVYVVIFPVGHPMCMLSCSQLNISCVCCHFPSWTSHSAECSSSGCWVRSTVWRPVICSLWTRCLHNRSASWRRFSDRNNAYWLTSHM